MNRIIFASWISPVSLCVLLAVTSTHLRVLNSTQGPGLSTV